MAELSTRRNTIDLRIRKGYSQIEGRRRGLVLDFSSNKLYMASIERSVKESLIRRAKGISPRASTETTDGQMPKASGRFIMPEDKQGNQQSKLGEVKSGSRRASGKVLHTAVQSGMEAINNNAEGGEELRESKKILMAIGAVGKRMFRTLVRNR